MNDKQSNNPTVETTDTCLKQGYEKPELRNFGSVSVLTMGGGATLADGINVTKMSDRSVKQHIVKMGVNSLGLGLYLYDYKAEFQNEMGAGKYFGVMADEVETILPDAVSIHPQGHKMVNYLLVEQALATHMRH